MFKLLQITKRVFTRLFALALLVTAGFGVQKSMKSDAELSDLALANVEAPAQSESGSLSDCTTYCMPANGYTCIIMWPGSEGITCTAHRKK